jgi:CubicO group peptidase (beta-lactamase class C family)
MAKKAFAVAVYKGTFPVFQEGIFPVLPVGYCACYCGVLRRPHLCLDDLYVTICKLFAYKKLRMTNPILIFVTNHTPLRKTSGLFILLSFYACTAFSRDIKEKLDSLMNYYAAANNFHGSVLVSYKGNVLLAKGYGYRDIERKLNNDPNTVFQLGTGTEQFTAEMMIIMDSQGKLALTDKLSKYFPGFPNSDKITLKHLLTHTSGIYNYMADPNWNTHCTKPMKMQDLLGLFRNKPLAFEPGERFAYSASDYVLLGCVIERITGRKYEDEVRQYILNVCSMTRSGFDFAAFNDDNKAIGCLYAGNQFSRAPVVDYSLSFSAGGLFSNVYDLYKWNAALHEYRLLPKDWQEIAYGPAKNRFALGWWIYTIQGKRFMQSSGTAPGFTSFEMRQEEDNIFIVLLENTTQPGEHNRTIAYNIIKYLYSSNIPAQRGKR